MNSDSRWGRSDSSTTDSSLRLSGVVISARDITYMEGLIPEYTPKHRRCHGSGDPDPSLRHAAPRDKRAVRLPLHCRPEPRETLGCIVQSRLLFTERESRPFAPVF